MSGQHEPTSPQPPRSPADLRAGRSEAVPGAAPGHDWPPEFGGQPGPEPTRYGDWEKNGRCTDF
jgi:hypothetical protein